MQKVTLYIWSGQPVPLLGYEVIETGDEDSPEGKTIPRQIPVFLLIFLSVGFGFLTASMFSVFIHLKDKREVGKLRKTIKKYEKEIDSLRIIPVKEGSDEDEKETSKPEVF